MPFNYETIRNDLFDSGGRPVPIDNKIPRKLLDWAAAEGVSVAPGDTANTILKNIATARSVTTEAGDTDLELLGKIAVEPASFGVWPYLQEIDAIPVSLAAPVLSGLGVSIQWPSAYPENPENLFVEYSLNGSTAWTAHATVPSPNYVLGLAVPTAKYYRARYGTLTTLSAWSNIVFIP